MRTKDAHARWRLGALALATLLVAGCHRTPAEQVIRDHIDAMQKAGNAHDVGKVVEPLSEDFVGSGDDEVTLDRKEFQRFLTFVQMREGGAVHANVGPITVTLQGTDRATATFTALVTGGAGLLPDDGQLEQVTTGWRLDDGDWKMISAQWKGVAK